jgi:hypothetical protein
LIERAWPKKPVNPPAAYQQGCTCECDNHFDDLDDGRRLFPISVTA